MAEAGIVLRPYLEVSGYALPGIAVRHQQRGSGYPDSVRVRAVSRERSVPGLLTLAEKRREPGPKVLRNVVDYMVVCGLPGKISFDEQLISEE